MIGKTTNSIKTFHFNNVYGIILLEQKKSPGHTEGTEKGSS